MVIYKITSDRLVQLDRTTFSKQGIRERDDLQRLVRDQIDVIDPEILIVGEEFTGWEDSQRRIDLLGVDKSANLVVIELKRTDDGGGMDMQAIRYAAMISKMTFSKVEEIYRNFLRKQSRHEDARQELLKHLGLECPAKSVPVELRQTGMEGAENGQGKEAHA